MTESRIEDHMGNDIQPGLWPSIRPPVIVGILLIVAFFGLSGGWAALAPLDSAAVAPGVVSVEGSRKTVQHLEGGIVSEILVKTGDRVKAGQILIRLDATLPKANLDLLRGRLLTSQALEARLKAERDGKEKIEFPKEIFKGSNRQAIKEIITGQINIFNARRKSLVAKVRILNSQIAQLMEEIKGLKGQIKSELVQIRLIEEEIGDISGLVKKGITPKRRLLSLKRRNAEINGVMSQHRAEIARANQAISETRLQISELHTTMTNKVVQLLQKTQDGQLDLLEKIRAAENILSRIDIRAPMDGTVFNLKVHTLGGVIMPGEDLLDIVPINNRLIIEARVDPKDIDVVRVGLLAQVRLTAFSRRSVPPIEGRVLTVSADTFKIERTGTSYYLARIELAKDLPKELDNAVIQPGMQAEVMIVTGERTLFEYLLKPVDRALNRSLRED